MNTFLYEDDVQSEELSEFELYQTEQEYWEEYDLIHNMR